MAQYYEAIGRRKESTARVRLMDGSGAFTVNEKDATTYFPRLGDLHDILRSFSAVGKDLGKSHTGEGGSRRLRADDQPSVSGT